MARKRLSNLNPEEAKKAPELKLESAKSPSPSKKADTPDTKTPDAKTPDAKTPTTPTPNVKTPNTQATSVEANVEKDLKSKPQTVESSQTKTQASQTKTQAKIFSIEPLEIDVPYVEVKDEEPASSQKDSGKAVVAESTDSDTGTDAAVYRAFESTIAELNATLDTVRQTAKHRENELLDQITELQTALQTQQATVKQLQAELKQSSQLKTELEEAKKMILQLSQVNAQPASPAPSSTKTQIAEPAPEPSTAKPIASSQPQALSKPQRDDRTPAIALQRQTTYPVRQNPFAISPEKKSVAKLPEQDSKLSDSDMGWVD